MWAQSSPVGSPGAMLFGSPGAQLI
jgi:hypothetical protein